MEYVLTNAQMRAADEYTIHTLGVPAAELMERAGRALADEAERLLDLRGKRIRERVLCVCGGGNNGGDGFVCARLLHARGVEADVVFFAEKTSAECRVAKEKFTAAGGRIYAETPLTGYAVVVDCLLGTGFHGTLSPAFVRAVHAINALGKAGAKVLSADIPSGVNGDNGRVESVAVLADETLCIGEKKAGVYLGDGIDYAGKTLRADIGISLPEPLETYAVLLTDKCVKALLPRRKRHSHKGTFGRAAIVAGSVEYTGAAYLATAACLRAGAGYTTLFAPADILPYYMLKAPEALLQPLCEGKRAVFSEERFSKLLAYDCIAYGMGMGVSEEVAKGAEYLLGAYTGKLLLDADGLNSLAAYKSEALKELFKRKTCDVLITPHVKEFSRLSGEDVASITEQGLFAPVKFAKEHGVHVLLKNAVSLLSDGERKYVNAAGNSGQAKGGSGDVLAGAIAGLCASGLSPFDGACVAAYVVGKAAELACEKIGEYSLTASDLIAYMGASFLTVSRG